MKEKFLVLVAKNAKIISGGRTQDDLRVLICKLEGNKPGYARQGKLLDVHSTINKSAKIIFDSTGIKLDRLFSENFKEVPQRYRQIVRKTIKQLQIKSKTVTNQ